MTNTKESVAALLNELAAANQPIPSLRAIRARLGTGSLSTISEAVKAWQESRLVECGEIPAAFSPEEAQRVAEAVWPAVQPILEARLLELRKNAQARIEIETQAAQKIQAAAADALAETEAARQTFAVREARLAELEHKLEAQQAELARCKADLEAARAELATARGERDEALKAAAASQAQVETMRKLIPLLDPKHLAPAKKK